ncbi:MAG: L-threonylcarbamoyladenylate synthase [Nanoarchaeota archaeon]|nr:L-threonylcarbamoyladenylate synthase [Nanoarchaeota archaeon]
MKIIKKEEFLENLEFYFREIREGKIFVYPTDTIYGIGCDATNDDSVNKIRQIKKRDEKPFSIIAPSKDWIKKDCVVDDNSEKWLNKLPGAYTLILELRNWVAVSDKVNFGFDSIGVRIPDHWISRVIENYGKPFVTTSVNISGEPFIKNIDNVPPEMKDEIDYAIDEGNIEGNPSTIVKLINGVEEIIRR